MATATEIFVALIGEGGDVWRPVQAEPVSPGCFRITSRNANPEDEVWEFTQGELVRCEQRTFSRGASGMVAADKVEIPDIRQPFLTCYDYGQGGVWAWVIAESAAKVQQAYAELTVLDRMPPWMTPEVLHRLESCDLNTTPPTGWLAILEQHRSAEACAEA